MRYLPVFEGARRVLEVHGLRQNVQPIIAATMTPAATELGVAFALRDRSEAAWYFFASPLHRQLISMWRAVKLLEKIERFDEQAVRASWYAAVSRVTSDHATQVRDFARLFESVSTFFSLRRRVLNEAPSEDELEHTLTLLSDNKIFPEQEEIEEEMKAGRIPSHHLMRGIVQRTTRRSKYWLQLCPPS